MLLKGVLYVLEGVLEGVYPLILDQIIFVCSRYHPSLDFDLTRALNVPASPRRLLVESQKSPLPLSKSLDPDQASPTNDKKLLAAKWSALYPPLPLSRSSASKHEEIKLDEEYEVSLNLSLNKERETVSDVERKTLAARWKGEDFLRHPSSAVSANAGFRMSSMKMEQPSSSSLEQTHNVWKGGYNSGKEVTEEADKLVESLFFVH